MQITLADVCEACDQENSCFHLLFLCPVFTSIRAKFKHVTRRAFAFDVFPSNDCNVQSAICIVGRKMYERIAAKCELHVTWPQRAERPSEPNARLQSPPRPRQLCPRRNRQNVMPVLNEKTRVSRHGVPYCVLFFFLKREGALYLCKYFFVLTSISGVLKGTLSRVVLFLFGPVPARLVLRKFISRSLFFVLNEVKVREIQGRKSHLLLLLIAINAMTTE